MNKGKNVFAQLLDFIGKYLHCWQHNDHGGSLLAAQRDPDRENPFSVSDYKTGYKSRIQSMPYYIKYYNGSWNIRYLNEQIKIALDRIDAHSDTKPADFSDLID